MQTLENISFNYYSSNIFLSKALGVVSLRQFINANKNPKQKVKEVLLKIADCKDDENKRKLKQSLYCFTPAVLIGIDTKRNYANIHKFTGLVQLDFDKLEDGAAAVQLRDWLFNSYPQVVTAYISPSKKGVKALMAIPEVKTVDEFKEYWLGIRQAFANIPSFDTATKNAILPLFISYDPDLKYREKWEVWTTKGIVEKTPFTQQVNAKQIKLDATQASYYKDKTINIFNNKIDSIVDNGHPQLIKACLVLGSRAAAGYIDEFEALSLIVNAIGRNSYLSKDTKGYIKTGTKMFGEGLKRIMNY
jgi:hypothetical protein